MKKYAFFICLVLLAGLSNCGKEPDEKKTKAAIKIGLLGAYYSPRYETQSIHWQKGYLRQKLTPPQAPVLGEYDNRQAKVIKQQVDWAQQAGIDFFVMNWWGPGTKTDMNLKNHFAAWLARQNSAFKFCLCYATPYRLGMLNFEIDLNLKATARMLADFTYLARTYFNHPNYLKINNRPVVMVYLSRCLTGDYKKALRQIRTIIKNQTRDTIYLLGDEVFWPNPEPDRIACYDGVTAYSMYGPYYARYAGFPETTGFFKDLAQVFKRYREAAQQKSVHFIPNVMPGFNDRGVLPEEKHYVLPREIAFGRTDRGSFYRSYFQTAKKYLDPELNMALINSWNDWTNDTQIEPIKPSASPVQTPQELTAGYNYYGYGETYLNITRQEKGK